MSNKSFFPTPSTDQVPTLIDACLQISGLEDSLAAHRCSERLSDAIQHLQQARIVVQALAVNEDANGIDKGPIIAKFKGGTFTPTEEEMGAWLTLPKTPLPLIKESVAVLLSFSSPEIKLSIADLVKRLPARYLKDQENPEQFLYRKLQRVIDVGLVIEERPVQSSQFAEYKLWLSKMGLTLAISGWFDDLRIPKPKNKSKV